MNGITQRLINTVEPIAGIIVYASPDGDYYIESHKIFNGTMGAGQPVGEDFLFEIAQKMKISENGPAPCSGGFMPKNILYLDQRTSRLNLIWYESPRKRFVKFDKQLKLKSGWLHFPGLVFHAYGSDLKVFALKRPPSGSAVLFRAPLFNTAADGLVCMGTAKAKYPEFPTYESIMEYWGKMLFGADFSHLSGAINPTNSSLKTLCKKGIDREIKFPAEELIAMKRGNRFLTLEDYIESL